MKLVRQIGLDQQMARHGHLHHVIVGHGQMVRVGRIGLRRPVRRPTPNCVCSSSSLKVVLSSCCCCCCCHKVTQVVFRENMCVTYTIVARNLRTCCVTEKHNDAITSKQFGFFYLAVERSVAALQLLSG
jgi:hypothetical protein